MVMSWSKPLPFKRKYFNYRGHRYEIVYTTAGGGKDALDAVKHLKARHPSRFSLSAIKKMPDGRYALGTR